MLDSIQITREREDGTRQTVTLDAESGKRIDEKIAELKATHEDGRFPIPEESLFESGFLVAPELERVAERLIAAHPNTFNHLPSLDVAYLWRKAGGSSNGKATLGKCQRPSGLLAHFSQVHYVIWLAADHIRDGEFTEDQVEACLFHEMLHTGLHEETMEPVMVPHDVETFAAEIRTYGLWTESLRYVGKAFKQARLFEDA